jgi:hypothetical protein
MDGEDYKGTRSLLSTVYTKRTLRNELLGVDFNTLFFLVKSHEEGKLLSAEK